MLPEDVSLFWPCYIISINIILISKEIVDQDALINALKDGKIFSAGLDVMTPEPLPTDSELLQLQLENCGKFAGVH